MSRSDKTSVAFRAGFISSINPEKATARVRFPDIGDIISHEMQILRRRTKGDREYWMYDEGEEVWCLFFGHGLEDGIIIGATYSDEDPLPATAPDKHRVTYKDETFFEYDRAEHKWTIHIEGEVDAYVKGLINLVCDDSVTAKIAKDVTAEVGGNVTATVKGNVTATVDGDVAVDAKGNISLKSGGNLDLEAAGNIGIKAGGNIKATAAGIDLN
jgi:phage baseplate assembly protein V